jgi:hypothetical protein
MEPIETETVKQNGHTYRVRIFADPDVPNPLEDCDEMGAILSLNRKHCNFDREGVEEAIENNPDAVPLSYFEHGQCLWSVAGELPPAACCPWDSVSFAGVWLPDEQTLASARNYGGSTRRHFMCKRARQACEVYSQWCNGDVYGYEVERVVTCAHCGEESTESIESCWGFFGLEYCRSEARTVLANTSPGL